MNLLGGGERNQIIGFERAEREKNALGQIVESPWVPLFKEWARVSYGGYSERREAAAEGQAQTAVFSCNQNSRLRLITPKDAIIFAGQRWDIEGIALHRNERIDFTAKVRRD